MYSWQIGFSLLLNEPRHEKNCIMPYANNKGADQTAHPDQRLCCSLPILAKSKIPRLLLASIAEQARLSLIQSQTPKTGFLMI